MGRRARPHPRRHRRGFHESLRRVPDHRCHRVGRARGRRVLHLVHCRSRRHVRVDHRTRVVRILELPPRTARRRRPRRVRVGARVRQRGAVRRARRARPADACESHVLPRGRRSARARSGGSRRRVCGRCLPSARRGRRATARRNVRRGRVARDRVRAPRGARERFARPGDRDRRGVARRGRHGALDLGRLPSARRAQQRHAASRAGTRAQPRVRGSGVGDRDRPQHDHGLSARDRGPRSRRVGSQLDRRRDHHAFTGVWALQRVAARTRRGPASIRGAHALATVRGSAPRPEAGGRASEPPGRGRLGRSVFPDVRRGSAHGRAREPRVLVRLRRDRDHERAVRGSGDRELPHVDEHGEQRTAHHRHGELGLAPPRVPRTRLSAQLRGGRRRSVHESVGGVARGVRSRGAFVRHVRADPGLPRERRGSRRASPRDRGRNARAGFAPTRPRCTRTRARSPRLRWRATKANHRT